MIPVGVRRGRPSTGGRPAPQGDPALLRRALPGDRRGVAARDLMHRTGHFSMRAALIYQHATSERDREIADAMDQRISNRDPDEPEDSVLARVG